MNKLKLELESLEVQTFETTGDGTGSGTVLGFNTYMPQESCHATYCGTCDATSVNCDDDTYDCPSVNIADCRSAYYTDCCDNGSGSFDRYTGDIWNPTCS